MSGQLKTRRTARAVRKMHPTEREVLLARLLLHLIDVLGNHEDMPVDLYDGVKAIAEPIVRRLTDAPA